MIFHKPGLALMHGGTDGVLEGSAVILFLYLQRVQGMSVFMHR